jgi:hypothetical protein
MTVEIQGSIFSRLAERTATAQQRQRVAALQRRRSFLAKRLLLGAMRGDPRSRATLRAIHANARRGNPQARAMAHAVRVVKATIARNRGRR